MRRPLLSLLVVLTACSALGFGCKPRVEGPRTAPGGVVLAPPRAPEAPYAPREKGDRAPAKEVVDLRQILANLERAQSYQSRIRTAQNGSLVAELLFSRKNGLQGILRASDGSSSEIYVRGTQIFTRYASTSWQDIGGTPEGQEARKQIADGLLVTENGGSRVLLRDSAKLIGTKNDPQGCKQYTLEQTFFQPQTFTQRLEICVKDTYPTRIKSTTPQGDIEIEYARFDDATILAVPPVRP